MQAFAQRVQDLRGFENLQQLPATVNSKASYGLWVDVNGPGGEEATGLIHLSEMDQDLDSFEVGQEMMVDVVYVEKERGHLGLSLRPQSRSTSSSSNSQEVQPTDIYACEWLEATVAGFSENEHEGVFVDVARPSFPKSSGFVPADRIDLPRRNLKSFFKAGDQVHVRVLGKSNGMLQLSMKGGPEDIKADLEAQLQSWQLGTTSNTEEVPLKRGQNLLPFASLSSSEWLDGQVLQAASYGIYVTVEPPTGGESCWGLVHLSEFSEEMLETDLGPGAEVQVRVVSVDQQHNRLFLSARQATADADSAAKLGTWLQGRVEDVHSYGLTLRTPVGRGLLYVTELDEYVEDPSSKFAPGDLLRVRVMDHMEEDLLALSMKTPEEVESKETPLFEEEPLPNAQDLQIRAMRQRLKDYLGISPQQPLTAQVQAETPFGLLLNVAHPDGKALTRLACRSN